MTYKPKKNHPWRKGFMSKRQAKASGWGTKESKPMPLNGQTNFPPPVKKEND